MAENTTPILYDFYGKQYDYNDLAQSADQGLNEYLETLRRGEKDQDSFRSAYSNIMAGIKDGTITFDNGQFHDSKGRYTNSDKKNRDYYGLIANYIYGRMGKSSVYQKPEDKSKIKWDNSSVRTALLKQLYNSDSENLQDFLDLDEEKDGVRAITNRSKYLADALQAVANNWDNTFQDYQDSDKTNYITLLNNAATALRDGTIDPGDYLALSKAVGGINFRDMMSTGTPKVTTESSTTQATEQPTSEQTSQQSTETPTTSYKTRSATLTDDSWNADILKQLSSTLSKVPYDGLINILRNSFYNDKYRFGTDSRIMQMFPNSNYSTKAGVAAILNVLKEQNKLQNADPANENLWYIPGLKTKQGTGWVWDSVNNTIKEMYLKDIPYAKQRASQDSKFTVAYKEGGVLKAQNGLQFQSSIYTPYKSTIETPQPITGGFRTSKVPFGTSSNQFGNYSTASVATQPTSTQPTSTQPTNTQSAGYNTIYSENKSNIDNGTYLNSIFQQSKVIDAMKQRYGNSKTSIADYEKDVLGNIEDRYNAKANNFNNSKTYTPSEAVETLNRNYQNKGNTFNYVLFGNSADEYDNQTGGVLYGLTKFQKPTTPMGTGDRYNNDKTKDYIDNAMGLQTYSRVMSLTNKDETNFGKWGDFWKSQGATGAYYATDADGNGQWIPTTDKTKTNYKTFVENKTIGPSDPKAARPNIEQINQELQTKSQNIIQQDKDKVSSSKINPTNEQKKNDNKQSTKDFVRNISPYLVGAGRMFYSMRQNEKIADTLLDATKPKLHNTYELYSPVTGAFSEMQNAYQRGAELRSQAAKFNTSDSAQNLANYLDTNRRVDQIKREGFLADDKEIKRTKAEALARQEDNAKRRSDLANKNMDNIIDNNMMRAQIKAEKLKNNWQSVDNFLQDAQNNLQEEANYRKQQRRELEERKMQANSQFDMQPFALHNQYQLNRLSAHYDNERLKLSQQLRADFKAKGIDITGDDTSWQNDPIYKTYLDNYYKLNNQESQDTYDLQQYQLGQTRDIYNKVYNNTMTGYKTPNPFGPSSSTPVESYNWYKILNGIKSSKKGGKLSFTTQYLLKKAMQ